jgi:hypothetical protein
MSILFSVPLSKITRRRVRALRGGRWCAKGPALRPALSQTGNRASGRLCPARRPRYGVRPHHPCPACARKRDRSEPDGGPIPPPRWRRCAAGAACSNPAASGVGSATRGRGGVAIRQLRRQQAAGLAERFGRSTSVVGDRCCGLRGGVGRSNPLPKKGTRPQKSSGCAGTGRPSARSRCPGRGNARPCGGRG